MSNTNNLPATAADLTPEMMQLLGTTAPTGGETERLPQLKINSKRKDKQNRKVPQGYFFVSGLDNQNELVYAESVKLRVLSQLYQWIHYDPEQNKVTNKTILIPSFNHEARDMGGTTRCGKPTSKDLREMSKAQQAKYSDIRCFRQLRGLVSYTGQTADGEQVTLENVPCILLLKGSNFSPFEDDMVKTLPRGKNFYDYWCDVTAEERENGSVTYYVMRFSPNYAEPASLDKPTIDTMLHMATLVKQENERIEKAYDKALANEKGIQTAVNALAKSALDSDFEDVDDDNVEYA